MVHKAWCCLRRVPSCLSRLSVKTNPKVSWLKKRRFWPKLGTFRLQIQQSIEEMILCFFKVIGEMSRSHGKNITYFDPNWTPPDCIFSLSSRMAMKWCTRLLAAQRWPIVLGGHPSNLKVSHDKHRWPELSAPELQVKNLTGLRSVVPFTNIN